MLTSLHRLHRILSVLGVLIADKLVQVYVQSAYFIRYVGRTAENVIEIHTTKLFEYFSIQALRISRR